jgi:hypothetical protein
MAFVVRAKSAHTADGTFQAEEATRSDAVKTAVDLLGKGMEGVTVTDETGRVFTPFEFGALVRK